MLFGMATGVSGEVWPGIMASHFTYGGAIWIAEVLFWSSNTLPKILQIETE